jgi:hypothetical protein
MTAAVLPLLARHPGRHARPGRQAAAVTHAVTAAAATGIVAAGWLLAAHPHPQPAAPRCVPFRSCACRYPEAPAHLNGNRLCVVLDEPAGVAAGGRP